MDEWRIQCKDVVLDKQSVLGRGSHGTVYKGKYLGAEVAVKEVHVPDISKQDLSLVTREIEVAAKCHHPNLVHLMGFSEDQGCLLIVMELLDCNLRYFIKHHHNQVNVKCLAIEIAQGLCCLHSNNPSIVHRDIKSDNILLKREGGRWIAKIGDYGTSKVLSKLMTPNRGTLVYAAPEAQTTDQQSPKVGKQFSILQSCRLKQLE